jgi:hypothetical protein
MLLPYLKDWHFVNEYPTYQVTGAPGSHAAVPPPLPQAAADPVAAATPPCVTVLMLTRVSPATVHVLCE